MHRWKDIGVFLDSEHKNYRQNGYKEAAPTFLLYVIYNCINEFNFKKQNL